MSSRRELTADSAVEVVAALVSETLQAHGIVAVLSGGAVVSIYTENEFQSHDLDYISSETVGRISAAMQSIGFVRERGRHFHHPATAFVVEFPAGPLMVGDQMVHRHAELETSYGVIRLLTPTDAVKDRLSAFFHWQDRQALEQALAICRRQPVDEADLARWAKAERQPGRFGIFLERLRLQS